MNSSVISATNIQIFRACCPRVSSLTTGIVRPEPTCKTLLAMPPLWQSYSDVCPCDSHTCPSVDGHTARPLLHPAVSDQFVLGLSPGTCSQAPPARHTALILLSSLSSTSLTVVFSSIMNPTSDTNL
jgi:hypothetical protein